MPGDGDVGLPEVLAVREPANLLAGRERRGRRYREVHLADDVLLLLLLQRLLRLHIHRRRRGRRRRHRLGRERRGHALLLSCIGVRCCIKPSIFY